jgi:hypothetical protein
VSERERVRERERESEREREREKERERGREREREREGERERERGGKREGERERRGRERERENPSTLSSFPVLQHLESLRGCRTGKAVCYMLLLQVAGSRFQVPGPTFHVDEVRSLASSTDEL